MEQIPMAEALFCVNCNTIFRMGQGALRGDCPHCAGRQVVPLDRWMSPFKYRPRFAEETGRACAPPPAFSGMIGE